MPVETFEVLNPVGEPGAKRETPASRVHDLNGKTIGQVSNAMFQAEAVLAAVGDLIKKRYPTAKVIPWTELPLIEAMGDVDKGAKKLSEALRQKGCDAVISSTGA